MERKQDGNFSGVKISSPEEIQKALDKKVNFDDLSEEYNPEEVDSTKALSQAGAKNLYDEINKNKLDKKDITHEFDTEDPDSKKVLSQLGANKLHKDKVKYRDITHEFKEENPSEKKVLSQKGANEHYKHVEENKVDFKDGTSEFVDIDKPSLKKYFNQLGATKLWQKVKDLMVAKEDIRDEFRTTDIHKEELSEEELKEKVFSWRGARDLYRWIKQNVVPQEGGEMKGSLTFPIRKIAQGIGIVFKDTESTFKVTAEENNTVRSFKLYEKDKNLLEIFRDKMVTKLNSLTTGRTTVHSDVLAPYSLGIGSDKTGINYENGLLCLYVDGKKIGTFSSEGMTLFGSRVPTVNTPINAVSVDIKKVKHNFHNRLVCYFDGNWQLADLSKEHTADGFAQRLDDDTFRVYFSGVIPIDSSIRDEKGNVLQLGEYYYVSQDVNGMVMRERRSTGVEQIAFKCMSVNNQVVAHILISSEANYNMLGDFMPEDEVPAEDFDELVKAMKEMNLSMKEMQEEIDRLNDFHGNTTTNYGANFAVIEKENHGFIFDAVYHENGEWIRTKPEDNIAEGIAIRDSADKVVIVYKGMVEIPKHAVDEENNPILVDKHYYLSTEVPGKFTYNIPSNGEVEQLAFKTILHGGKLKAIIFIDENATIDY